MQNILIKQYILTFLRLYFKEDDLEKIAARSVREQKRRFHSGFFH